MQTTSRREALLEMYSDMYKDAHGSRPRGYSWERAENMTLAELEAEFEYLESVIKQNIEEEKAAENRAVRAFEQTLENLIEIGAKDRVTAIKWLIDGEEMVGGGDGIPAEQCDLSFFCYLHGLPYGYITKEDLA